MPDSFVRVRACGGYFSFFDQFLLSPEPEPPIKHIRVVGLLGEMTRLGIEEVMADESGKDVGRKIRHKFCLRARLTLAFYTASAKTRSFFVVIVFCFA